MKGIRFPVASSHSKDGIHSHLPFQSSISLKRVRCVLVLVPVYLLATTRLLTDKHDADTSDQRAGHTQEVVMTLLVTVPVLNEN